MSNTQQTLSSLEEKPVEGIGGWLILPLIGLCVSPFVGLYGVWQLLPTFELLGQLSTVQSAFVVLETVVNVAIQIVVPIILLVMMLRKRSRFPRLYQMLLGFAVVWNVFDLFLAYVLFRQTFDSGAAELLDSETLRSIAQSVIGAAIWIPYMSRSVRVKNTFVN